MTDRLEEIAARHAQATPGPWERGGHNRIHSAHPALSRAGGDGNLRYSDESGWEHEGDIKFIAASWEDTRWLIEEVRRLRLLDEHEICSMCPLGVDPNRTGEPESAKAGGHDVATAG